MEDSHLADGPPRDYATSGNWVPLYMPEKLKEHLPAVLAAYGPKKVPSLMAIVPVDLPLGTDREFLLTNFHNQDCLKRQSLKIGGRWKQLAFCPYCGVLNENAETAYGHVRKHLDLMLVCGGCQTKSFLHGQALHKHMKDNCPAIVAILGKTRGSKK